MECCKHCGSTRGWIRMGRCHRCHDIYAKVRGKASSLINAAIKRGTIAPAKQFKCTDCDAQASRYDHRDYDKPMEVVPVCVRCNQLRGNAKVSDDHFNLDLK